MLKSCTLGSKGDYMSPFFATFAPVKVPQVAMFESRRFSSIKNSILYV